MIQAEKRYYRKFTGGDITLAEVWKMSRIHSGEVSKGNMSVKISEVRESSTVPGLIKFCENRV